MISTLKTRFYILWDCKTFDFNFIIIEAFYPPKIKRFTCFKKDYFRNKACKFIKNFRCFSFIKLLTYKSKIIPLYCYICLNKTLKRNLSILTVVNGVNNKKIYKNYFYILATE